MDINTDLSCSRIMDPDRDLSDIMGQGITMASGGSTGHFHPLTSAWIQAAAQTTDILMSFVGNMGHEHQ
jgi:hypothetical protein